ncbi:rna-binding domain-containing protein [Phaffia rhodozyma]|uniref:Rna-binding domain-containing protein n=1 Tax=Phaffia rhodozyma TaxID=264483 RepID=A0A0F7SUY5_PHARH|nr:rna-binding domain-containing protein [Phaffia rhodozyma]
MDGVIPTEDPSAPASTAEGAAPLVSDAIDTTSDDQHKIEVDEQTIKAEGLSEEEDLAKKAEEEANAKEAAEKARLEAEARLREEQEKFRQEQERIRLEQIKIQEEKDRAERATWTETLYIHNLNEKVKLPVMKQCLGYLFKMYAPVLDIVAHTNVRMRGQAFVSFENKEIAAKALKEVKGFPLYGKPMQIEFARTKSDAVVRKLDDAGFDQHKELRKEHKKKARVDNPHRQKEQAKRKAAADAAAAASAADPASGEAGSAAGLVAAPVKRVPVQMPDEYLPPNTTLFIQNLVDGVTKEDLEEQFSKYPNLVAVRVIAARRDIAFVDYADEASSTLAREGLNNFKMGPGEGEAMRVTFARK